MLKILHTADWHIGKSFDQFGPEAAATLARDRLGVIDRIMGCASQFDVDAVLCAGDLFDRPDPDDDWWKGLAAKFDGYRNWRKPVVLLPGNHDPLTDKSVYDPPTGFAKPCQNGFTLSIEMIFKSQSHQRVLFMRHPAAQRLAIKI